ncbi:unnamed protein product [Pieris macdunnoughi]|uniref:Endonuclease/exonuclease/phosphatase domain-containing protein n=1 Tax=Pieris macdunnoughi TaxID=345717 RepID=A0A821RCH2_9NEOP|nr:unnamed protein product [Pieris macdunnoughi]
MMSSFRRLGGVNSATAVCAPLAHRTDLIQANLHSQTASASLRRLLETNPKTIAAIQEPWIRNGKICGLGTTGGKLLLDTSREKLELIIAADFNAHHTLWGNDNTNAREPTFINARSQTIIDLTMVTAGLSDHIQDWNVSSELSYSDHRWIHFAIKGELPKSQPRRISRRTDSVKFYRLISSEVDKLTIPTTIDIQDIDKHVKNLTSLLLTSYEQSYPLTIPRWEGRHN